MVSQMRACGMIIVMMTEVRPASAPTMTQILQPQQLRMRLQRGDHRSGIVEVA